jgi:hypothetical protein
MSAPARPQVLFVCGSINQTTQMDQIAAQLPECDAWFTPYYCDGLLDLLRRAGALEFTILGDKNSFPHRGYVLVCTSDARETLKRDDRGEFLDSVAGIAEGRPVIFKLHPNEKVARATREVQAAIPGALVFSSGSAEEMIANCDVLITQYSSTVFVGLALGKEVHSYFDRDELRRLMPVQNASAAANIAEVCRELLAATARDPGEAVPASAAAIPARADGWMPASVALADRAEGR